MSSRIASGVHSRDPYVDLARSPVRLLALIDTAQLPAVTCHIGWRFSPAEHTQQLGFGVASYLRINSRDLLKESTRSGREGSLCTFGAPAALAASALDERPLVSGEQRRAAVAGLRCHREQLQSWGLRTQPTETTKPAWRGVSTEHSREHSRERKAGSTAAGRRYSRGHSTGSTAEQHAPLLESQHGQGREGRAKRAAGRAGAAGDLVRLRGSPVDLKDDSSRDVSSTDVSSTSSSTGSSTGSSTSSRRASPVAPERRPSWLA